MVGHGAAGKAGRGSACTATDWLRRGADRQEGLGAEGNGAVRLGRQGSVGLGRARHGWLVGWANLAVRAFFERGRYGWSVALARSQAAGFYGCLLEATSVAETRPTRL